MTKAKQTEPSPQRDRRQRADGGGQGPQGGAAADPAGRHGRRRHPGAPCCASRRCRPETVEDVILGCAMPEAEQGMNVARPAALLAGVPSTAAAVTVNRFCASGLQAIALAARAIEAGEADVIVAGGTESMSLIPMGGHKISPNPTLLDRYPDVYLGMGLTAEIVARKYGIGREASDAFALESHRKAVAAIDAGRFKDEIVPLEVSLDGKTVDLRHRRGAAPGHRPRGPRQAQARVCRGGHRHRRQRVADVGRRRGHRPRVGRPGRRSSACGRSRASSPTRWRACLPSSWASAPWRRSRRPSGRRA